MSEPASTGAPECVCFNLRRAARQVTQAFDLALRPAGLQGPQFSLLAALNRDRGNADGIRVSTLADQLGLDRTTLTRNLAVAERKGWIETRPGADDRRERLVCLTEAGERQFRAAFPYWKKAQSAAVEKLGKDGLATLLELTRRFEEQ